MVILRCFARFRRFLTFWFASERFPFIGRTYYHPKRESSKIANPERNTGK